MSVCFNFYHFLWLHTCRLHVGWLIDSYIEEGCVYPKRSTTVLSLSYVSSHPYNMVASGKYYSLLYVLSRVRKLETLQINSTQKELHFTFSSFSVHQDKIWSVSVRVFLLFDLLWSCVAIIVQIRRLPFN